MYQILREYKFYNLISVIPIFLTKYTVKAYQI
jgi:hypothetical protein